MQERTREESYWPALDGSAASSRRTTILVKRKQSRKPQAAATDSRSGGTPATAHMLSSQPGMIQVQVECHTSETCIPGLHSESVDRVGHSICADGTVRHPYPSELTGRGGYLGEHLRYSLQEGTS